ncbi:hypothetical protein [Chelativorans sp. AA-79]|uniref:hypothetical protein n=1 Tax=Chelativorans sp. AA-79 TaxID=3028735 RepID=UPI0023F8406A|nr:hypothetical protein [Chelativorans sp. AA-79]WEX10293.1 hypothetical protein PVE73_04860 [Chelativorans sp. AA-79]
MASWWRDIAQQLGVEGSGSWKRRIAQALQAMDGDGPWAKHIAEKGVTTIPADGAIVTDGQAANVLDATGNSTLATGAVEVSGDPAAFHGVTLPANYAVMQDGVDDIDVLDFGAGAGQVAGVGRVSSNAGNVQLANATTKIAIHAAPITIVDQGGKTAGATVAVDQGNWQNFPLVNATDAIVSDAQALTVPVTGTYTTTATLTVAGGVITAIELS